MPISATPRASAFTPPAAAPRERLDSRQWSYSEIEELCVSGAIDSLWVYSRPVSRADVASGLLLTPAADRTDPRWRRLAREFAREIGELDSASAGPYSLPALHSSNGRGSLAAWPRARAGLDKAAGQGWNSSGPTELGVQTAFTYRPRLVLYLDLTARNYPGSRGYADPLFTNTDITMLTGQAYASVSLPPGEIAAGRDRVRWGPGQTGSLILGDAADPMTLVQHGATWHRLHFTALTAWLDSFRGEFLSGHRLEWQTSKKVFLAASEVARYPSPRGVEPLYLVGVVPYTLVQRLITADGLADSGLNARNNVMISLEGTWRPRPGVQLAAVWLADDFKTQPGQPQSRTGWQVNALVSPPRRARPWTLRVEWTRVRNYVYTSSYGEGFIFHETSLGYPLGPDLSRVTAQFAVDANENLRLHVGADYLAKGEGSLGESLDNSNPDPNLPPAGELQGVVEKDLALTAGGRLFLRDNLRLEAELGPMLQRNADHIEGRSGTPWIGSLSLDFRW